MKTMNLKRQFSTIFSWSGSWITAVGSRAASSLVRLNNGLEATNAVIKKECTLRKRLSVGDFFRKVFDLVRDWFKERDQENPNYRKPFAEKTFNFIIRLHCSIQVAQIPDASKNHSTKRILHKSFNNVEKCWRQVVQISRSK